MYSCWPVVSMATPGATVAPSQETRDRTPSTQESWSEVGSSPGSHASNGQNGGFTTNGGPVTSAQVFSINSADWQWVYSNRKWHWMNNADISRNQGDSWGWVQSMGWFNLESRLLHNGGSSNGDPWANYCGSKQSSGTPWAPGETSWDRWSTNAWQYASKKLRDGDVPEWDGKTHRTIYFHKIDL